MINGIYFRCFLKTLKDIAALAPMVLLAACTGIPADGQDDRVYHCVGTNLPIAPPNTFLKPTPQEKFVYGDFEQGAHPSTGRNSYCNILRVPKTAYLRYRFEGKVLEKHFDLSALTPRRLYVLREIDLKTVEFFVNGDVVEVLLVTPIPGTFTSRREVITRQ